MAHPLPHAAAAISAQSGPESAAAVEWPTLALILACTAVWAGASAGLTLGGWAWAAWPLLCLSLVLHSSLCHEALHGHPTRWAEVNAALVAPAMGLFIPYGRFRDQHLAHHRDARLTDPYDDPESNYLDPAVWRRLPRLAQALLSANNTLAGRVLLGPAIGLWVFYGGELRAIWRGEPGVAQAWALHLVGLAPVLAWLWWWQVPVPAYGLAAYLALGILKIRTFLEHRAHETVRARSVIIEDRGPLAFLFLNNNLHAVHHGHPGLAWYRLPGFYRARRQRFLEMNDGYRYPSYADVIARFLLRRKDPVAHPLWDQDR
ncbi:MAG: fatty acid desaturase [Pseudomonadota bacterium]